MRFFKYTVVFTPESDEPDVYNVSVPAFPEICTFGTSYEEAKFMAQDALELVILSRLEDGEEISSDKKPKKMPINGKVEEIFISVSHQVTASPAKHVKTAIFQSA